METLVMRTLEDLRKAVGKLGHLRYVNPSDARKIHKEVGSHIAKLHHAAEKYSRGEHSPSQGDEHTPHSVDLTHRRHGGKHVFTIKTQHQNIDQGFRDSWRVTVHPSGKVNLRTKSGYVGVTDNVPHTMDHSFDSIKEFGSHVKSFAEHSRSKSPKREFGEA